MTYGYSGGAQRVVAMVDGARKVLCWGDDISEEEIEPFIAEYGHAWIEAVDSPALEALTHPPYEGRA